MRGQLLNPRPESAEFEQLDDALISIDAAGRIESVVPAPADCEIPESHPGCVLLPGFVDTHVHFPQVRVLGSATGPLLDWLERTVFPEEARFAEEAYARVVAAELVDRLIRYGTTCASIFSSSHPRATAVLFEELERRGLRGQAGLTLMDRNCPDELRLEAGPALEACRDLVERFHGLDGDRLRFCVTPRFAISCSEELLTGAGRLAEELGLPVQTHLSENVEEIRAAAELFPECGDYLAVYEDHGLAGPRALMAHCVWLGDDEWRRMAATETAVSHCPDSNFFLGSGCMPLRRAHEEGVRVGLGTDVGAGRSFSMRRVCASGYDAALVRGDPVSAEQLVWHATRGGALALGLGDRVGRIEPGMDADLVAIDVPAHTQPEHLFDAVAFRRDDGAAVACWVRGERLR